MNSTRLNLERLEDRSLPATFGIPWADARLTLSFAPDGTPIAGRTSDLFEGLGTTQSESEWKLDVLRAFHTWTSVTNLDIAVVPDAGTAFGTAGRLQNDPRFGDIRIGGNRLSSDVLAISSPPDPAFSGTLAGDIFVNTNYRFDGSPYDLYTVLLHEAGHSLGLDHSPHPNSPMYERFQNPVGSLTANDLRAIRSLYGVRKADRFEGATGNDTSCTARRLPTPTNYRGATPLLAFADLTTESDSDVFWFDSVPALNRNENVTVRVQSAGLSLLGARLTVYTLDANGHEQEVANVKSDSADLEGDTLQVTFDGNDDDDTSTRYYLRIEAAEDAPFRLGRYAVAVTFEGANVTPMDNLDRVILGSYQSLGADALAALLRDPSGTLVNPDGGTNETISSASRLAPLRTTTTIQRYEALGSLGSSTDRDVYRISTPTTGAGRILTATIWALPEQSIRPRIEVHDEAGNRVPAEVLVNDLGTFTVQAIDLLPHSTYYLSVADSAGEMGNYFLSADLGAKATEVRLLSQGTIVTSRTDMLYIGQAQLVHFVLSANAPLRMTITDESGAILFDRTADEGTPVSGSAIELRPGRYRVCFERVGEGTTPIEFKLIGNRITDPLGPVVDDPTLVPTYRDPNNSKGFLYPGGFATTDPFFWLFGV